MNAPFMVACGVWDFFRSLQWWETLGILECHVHGSRKLITVELESGLT